MRRIWRWSDRRRIWRVEEFSKNAGSAGIRCLLALFLKNIKNQRFLKKSDIFIMSSFYEKLLILVKGDDCKRQAVIVHGTA